MPPGFGTPLRNLQPLRQFRNHVLKGTREFAEIVHGGEKTEQSQRARFVHRRQTHDADSKCLVGSQKRTSYCRDVETMIGKVMVSPARNRFPPEQGARIRSFFRHTK